MARTLCALLLALLVTSQTRAGERWDAHPDSLELAYGLRFGICSGPAAYSISESRVLEDALKTLGVQIAVRQGNYGQLAAGLELMQGPRYATSGWDSVSSIFEHIRYSAVFLYVSPGIQVRLGKDQPLSLGASVDLGPLWTRERTFYAYLFDADEYLEVERSMAIRPKFVMSYNLSHKVQVHFEYGWIDAGLSSTYSSAYFADNWYIEIPRSYDGPYFSASITATRPIARNPGKFRTRR